MNTVNVLKKKMMKVPLNKRHYSVNETEYIKDSLIRGDIGGDGYYTGLVTSFIQDRYRVEKVLMTTSATHALEMACMLMKFKAGDEVIMPSYSFPSTANAVLLSGARPVFAEIECNVPNIDPEDIEKRITPNTRAIMAVHYAGIGCRIDDIIRIAEKYGLMVIEDAAQAVNARYKGRYLGSWGHMGCFSFHSTKNFTSGEGGAFLFNHADGEIIERAEILRQKGTNRNSFLKGVVDKYCWVDIGSSYSPSDLIMALLYSQLMDAENITDRRRAVHSHYCNELKKYTDRGILKVVHIPEECEPNYHLFYILFPEQRIRDRVMGKLNERGIAAAIHFVPLHSSPMGARLGYKCGDLPLTEKISGTLLRLPIYSGMTTDEMQYVTDHLRDILEEV